MTNTILVIDDDSDILEMYKDSLVSNDFSVKTAQDGLEGIAMYKQIKPKLVLLDSSMPKIDGFETFKKIIEFDDKAKVVMITGYSHEDSLIADAIKNGLESAIIKPIGLDQIIDLARRYIR